MEAIDRASKVIAGADALLIGAGAGMGVDSGMPDFRGPEGFWRAYPPYAKLGLRFEQMASPDHFRNDPPLGWGFYGHRTNLYRRAEPHPGFAILQEWANRMAPRSLRLHLERRQSLPEGRVRSRADSSNATARSNTDNASSRCGVPGSFEAEPVEIEVDPETFRAVEPRCQNVTACGGLARPNILMFGDWGWNGEPDPGSREAGSKPGSRDWDRPGSPSSNWGPAKPCRRSGCSANRSRSLAWRGR